MGKSKKESIEELLSKLDEIKAQSVRLNSIGLLPLLTVAFIVLKLCGVISWSWVWVLAPFWIPIALVIVLILLAIVLPAATIKKKNNGI